MGCGFLALLLTCLLRTPDPAAQEADVPLTYAERYYRQAQELLRRGDREECRQTLLLVLERDDRHLPALAELGRMAEEDGDIDRGLWYYLRYVNTVGRITRLRGAEREAREQVLERVEILDPLPRELDRAISSHVRNLKAVASNYLRRKFYASALRAYLQVQALAPQDEDVAAAIAEIRTEGGADVAVEDFRGGADPLAEYSAEWIAEQDAAHATWETAYRKETRNYTIVTDAGFEVLETVALVMEQMNQFYREVFRHAEDGEPTPHIEVWVFRDRAEFDAIAKPGSRWVGGYYDGSKVTAYDGGGSGESRRDLYVVLFHEAGHQFVDLAGGPVPKWLNEGIASYFEGARILSNRQVVRNLVAKPRLLALHGSLFGPGKKEPIPLRRLLQITYDSGEYGPDHYPYGWGLVYFLLNFEDAEGKQAYRDLFDEYFKSFRPPESTTPGDDPKEPPRKRRGRRKEPPAEEPAEPPRTPEEIEFERLAKLSPVQRFEEFFVTRAGVPGISDLGQFEATFHEYIRGLFLLETGDRGYGMQQLDLARQRLAADQLASAAGILERIVAAHPRWAEPILLLAEVAEQEGRRDRAMNLLRDYLSLRGEPADVAATRARDAVQERLVELDPLKSRWDLLDRKLYQDIDALVSGYDEADMPMVAMHCLDELRNVRRFREEAEARLDQIELQTGRSLKRWRLLFNEYDLDGWYGATGDQNYRVQDGLLCGRVTAQDRDEGMTPNDIAYRILFVDREVLGDYTFEAEMLSVRDPDSSRHCKLLGLAFGARSTEMFWALNFLPFGTLDFGSFQGGWETDRKLTRIYGEEEWIRLRLQVSGNEVTAFLDDQECFRKQLPEGAVRGDFGVLTGDGHARFRNLRILTRW